MKKFTNKFVNKSIRKVFSAKKRRGITAVVTGAILISAVAVMGVALVGWANTSLFTKQAVLEASFNEKMNKLNEDLLIEHIWFGGTTNNEFVNVTINNVGTVGFNVTKIEIVNSTDTLFDIITDGGIATNDYYDFQRPFEWDSGETTDFTITTERGNIFTAQEVT